MTWVLVLQNRKFTEFSPQNVGRVACRILPNVVFALQA